jgi:hypothetical protein
MTKIFGMSQIQRMRMQPMMELQNLMLKIAKTLIRTRNRILVRHKNKRWPSI